MNPAAIKTRSIMRMRVSASVLSLMVLLFPAVALAQSITPPAKPAAAEKNKEDETVMLNPFEVTTEKDTSYGALNSNSLTLFNVELDKVPVVADVLTQQFIQDTSVRSLEDLFNNYAGGAGRVYATDTDINGSQSGDRFSSDQYGVRGVAAGLPKRDGFQNFRTQQNEVSLFDVERLDVVHGSQGLLYGAAGAGGVVNLVSKQAKFNSTSGRFSERIDQYGSHQSMLDANYGRGPIALRMVALHDANQTRRLFIGNKTEGLYAQLAVRLPLNTTVRMNAETTHNHRQLPNNLSLSFPAAVADPRNGQNLLYLLTTGQTGAINPKTGAAYPGGAITRVPITTENYASFLGWHSEDDADVRRGGISIDSVLTPWLSTSFAASYYLKYGDRDPNGSSLLAPGATNNPTGDWAVAPSFSDSSSSNRAKMYRASVLLTKELFHGIARTQTAIGFNRTYEDTTSQGGNNVIYNYYLADASGNVPFDITKTNGGRTSYGAQAWTVGDGPIKNPSIKSGAATITRNGQLYVRQLANPRSPDWILPNNPMGLASLYANFLNRKTAPTSTSTNSISGGNASGFESETKGDGYFLANNTDWFDGKLQTFFGFRESSSFGRDPNATVGVNVAYVEDRQGPFPSYNAGLVYKLMSLPGNGALRGYYGFSRTWNVANGDNDAYGLLPPNPKGVTHEGGFKFTGFDNRVSGNLSFFVVDSKNENYSAGSTYANTVNPTGLNGAYVSPTGAKGNWAHYDKTTRGVELALTAQPTRNWGMRAAVSLNDGTVKSDSVYALLYNDQFTTNSAKTAVQYANGQPFLVPADTDAAGIAKVNALALGTKTDPATLSTNLVPLTLAMINDVNSNYYAFGKGTIATNQPQNGSIGTGTTGSGTNTLKIALVNFQAGGSTALTGATGLPISAMQYNWSDPSGFKDRGYIVQRKGDATVGYPVFRLNLTQFYEFSEGWLKGLRPGGSVAFAAWNHSYWYATPDLKRHLYQAALPNPAVNVFASYSRRFGKYRWTTQVNVNNLFNHYQLNFTPNNGAGFTNPNNIGVSYSGEPRLWVWTNSVQF
jgi:outer membrane receptor for ferric coprogen and ferric-rhodotorulic acid